MGTARSAISTFLKLCGNIDIKYSLLKIMAFMTGLKLPKLCVSLLQGSLQESINPFQSQSCKIMYAKLSSHLTQISPLCNQNL